MYTIMSLANRDSFISSFPIHIHFIIYSYLNALARTSSSMLNNSVSPCLVPNLRGKAFRLSLAIMLVVVSLKIFFIKFKKLPSILIF